MEHRLLIVEDDTFLRDGLRELLDREGYGVSCAADASQAAEEMRKEAFDLIILDVMLPDRNGLTLCGEWRGAGINTPILFLTACDDEVQIVRGLDAGGDDYVTKPFRLRELLSRIRALLRRNIPAAYASGGLRIDLQKRSACRNGEAVPLTPTEFQLLSVLVRSNGRVLTRRQLLQSIWDDAGLFIEDNTLSVHISRLREKIGGEHIRTVRGVGYRWEERNDESRHN